MGMEGGKMVNREKTVRLKSLHFRCGIQFADVFVCKAFRLVPGVGLSNMMVSMVDDGSLDIIKWKTFGDVENEYGVYAAIEPSVTFKRFVVSLPVSFERIFSSPERFSSVALSCQAGYRFGK
jgi:hypothetical protein